MNNLSFNRKGLSPSELGGVLDAVASVVEEMDAHAVDVSVYVIESTVE